MPGSSVRNCTFDAVYDCTYSTQLTTKHQESPTSMCLILHNLMTNYIILRFKFP